MSLEFIDGVGFNEPVHVEYEKLKTGEKGFCPKTFHFSTQDQATPFKTEISFKYFTTLIETIARGPTIFNFINDKEESIRFYCDGENIFRLTYISIA